jgi:hypothetical protein
MAELRLRVLQSRFQSAYFTELAQALVDESARLGTPAEISVTPIDPGEGDVLVLLAADEYLTLEGTDWLDDPAVAARTIGISALTADSVARRCPEIDATARLGAVFDFGAPAVRGYRRRGIAAEHLPFGWTPTWDRFDPEQPFQRDLLFMGRSSPRRQAALGRLSRPFWTRPSAIVLPDDDVAGHRPSEAFVTGGAKRELIAGSATLLNLHRDEPGYFEWLRAVEAAHCGAVLLSEPSVHQEPFVSGEHLVVAPQAMLAAELDALLADPDRLRTLRNAAYQLIRGMPFATGVARLLSVAQDVRRRTEPVPVRVGPRRQVLPPRSRPAGWARPETGGPAAQAVKDLRLDLIELRRLGAAARFGSNPADTVIAAQSPSWEAARPQVSVVVALYDQGHYVWEALDSAAFGDLAGVEIVVVDDGSTDDSARTVVSWMDSNPQVPARLLRHPVNRGLPHARNTAAGAARGELVMVLDADNLLAPTGLVRLVRVLRADPAAWFAYGVLQRFDAAGPAGLAGTQPWQPDRLRYGNDIDACALIRADLLRRLDGYSTDRRLYGWEHYDLWCRIAEYGGRGAHVPTVIGRHRQRAGSMAALSEIGTDAAYDALREHAPKVMSGALDEQRDGYESWLTELAQARIGRDTRLRRLEAGR